MERERAPGIILFGPPFWLIAFGSLSLIYEITTFLFARSLGEMMMDWASKVPSDAENYARIREILYQMNHFPTESGGFRRWDELLHSDFVVSAICAVCILGLGLKAPKIPKKGQPLLGWMGTLLLLCGTMSGVALTLPLYKLNAALYAEIKTTAARFGVEWLHTQLASAPLVVIFLEVAFAFALGILSSRSGKEAAATSR